MPELPEAERARQALEQRLGREVVAVDDRDAYVCRPHSAGEIASALVGHTFIRAARRGKLLWLESAEGPALGLHLGMAGTILLDPSSTSGWDRFRIDFADGSSLVLRDKRRLGRAVLNPDLGHVGPDAAEISRDEFRRRVGAGRTPVKARLLDQHALAGVGNLLADEALWQARLSPRRLTGELATEELDRLRRELRRAIRAAIRHGGVHTGRFVQARKGTGVCPRDGEILEVARIGGRTTIWCPTCQR